MKAEVNFVVAVVDVDEDEVASTEEEEESEEVAVKNVLNPMESVFIVEENDISPSAVNFVSKRKVKVVFQNHNITSKRQHHHNFKNKLPSYLQFLQQLSSNVTSLATGKHHKN